MKKHTVAILLLFLFIPAAISQDRVLSGIVFNTEGDTLYGVQVHQPYCPTKYYTGFDGKFKVLYNEAYDSVLIFSFIGLRPEVVAFSEFDEGDVVINMKNADGTQIDYPGYETYSRISKLTFTSSIKFDFIYNNFEMYESSLGHYSDSLLEDSSIGITTISFALKRKWVQFGYELGFNYNSVLNYNDSIDFSAFALQNSIFFSCYLIDSKRFSFAPYFNLKLSRYQFTSNLSGDNIPFEYYMENRNIDLRFNQVTGIVGASIDYKMFDDYYFHSDYWTIGIYGGYIFKINEIPWLYSKRMRLNDNRQILMKNYSFGLRITFNIL